MKVFAILAVLLAMFAVAPTFAEDSDDNVAVAEPEQKPTTVDDFKTKLADSGKWIDVEGVGLVWQPNEVVADANWQPYCDGGHWVSTDNGWVFASSYSWSWACYHYGRWYRHASAGWVWVPGYTWGPSWVCWRSDADHYGWAPLPPACEFVAGVGFRFHGRNVGFDFDFGIGVDEFCFVSCSNFLEINIGLHRCHHDECHRIFAHTVCRRAGIVHEGHFINHGFPRKEVARFTHHEVVVHHAAAREARREERHEQKHQRQEKREERHEQRHEKREERHEQKQQRQEQRHEQTHQRQEQHQQQQHQRQEQRQQHQQQRQPQQRPAPQRAAPPQHHSSPPAVHSGGGGVHHR